MTAPEPAWRRLDRRTVLVTALEVAAATVVVAVPIVLAIAGGGRHGFAAASWAVTGVLVLTAGATAADLARWRTTRFRLTEDRLEFDRGIVVRRSRALARERIRTVDVTAHPLLRLLGLARVEIGTGDSSGLPRWIWPDDQVIVLDPLPRVAAEGLGTELLPHAATRADEGGERLATWRPGWLRYAPLSVWTLVLAGGAVAVTFQVADWFGAGDRPVRVALALADRVGAAPALVVIALIAVVVLVGAAVNLILFAEAWWGFRLTCRAGTLQVARGLLIARSLSLDETRIRGAQLVEPLGVRLASAARVDVVATGLATGAARGNEPSTLHPAAPRGDATNTLAAVLHSPRLAETLDDLVPHPPAARDRRLRRAAGAVVVLLAVVVALRLFWSFTGLWTALLALVTAATVTGIVALALDSARSLGHRLDPDRLITRHGTIRRATTVLNRDGIIGWRIRQSILQRRTGLVTITATTAAGKGRYSIIDTHTAHGVGLAARAVPGLLDPFRNPTTSDEGATTPGQSSESERS